MLWGAPRLLILGFSRKWAAARFFYWVHRAAMPQGGLDLKWLEETTDRCVWDFLVPNLGLEKRIERNNRQDYLYE